MFPAGSPSAQASGAGRFLRGWRALPVQTNALLSRRVAARKSCRRGRGKEAASPARSPGAQASGASRFLRGWRALPVQANALLSRRVAAWESNRRGRGKEAASPAGSPDAHVSGAGLSDGGAVSRGRGHAAVAGRDAFAEGSRVRQAGRASAAVRRAEPASDRRSLRPSAHAPRKARISRAAHVPADAARLRDRGARGGGGAVPVLHLCGHGHEADGHAEAVPLSRQVGHEPRRRVGSLHEAVRPVRLAREAVRLRPRPSEKAAGRRVRRGNRGLLQPVVQQRA